MKEPRDAYKVLQVDPEAELEVIQAAYRRLAQKYHPDRASSTPDGDADALRMVELNAAWAQLRDPERRGAYDRERARAASQPTRAPGPGFSPAAPPRDAAAPSSAGSTTTVHGTPAVGPPPGRPSGSVLTFGRYSGWSLGEIGRVDPGYLAWLDRMPIGRPYRAELDALLRRLDMRLTEQAEADQRRGLFRRR
jgi:curved DNA-binding protein CbpA